MVMVRAETKLTQKSAFKLVKWLHEDETWGGGQFIEHIKRGLARLEGASETERIVFTLHDAFEPSKQRKGRAADYTIQSFIEEFEPSEDVMRPLLLMIKPDACLYYSEYVWRRAADPTFRKLKAVDNNVNASQIDERHLGKKRAEKVTTKTQITRFVLNAAKEVFEKYDPHDLSGGFSLADVWDTAMDVSSHAAVHKMLDNLVATDSHPAIRSKIDLAKQVLDLAEQANIWQNRFQFDRVRDRAWNGPPEFLGGTSSRRRVTLEDLFFDPTEPNQPVEAIRKLPTSVDVNPKSVNPTSVAMRIVHRSVTGPSFTTPEQMGIGISRVQTRSDAA